MLQKVLHKHVPAKQKNPNDFASLKIDRLSDKTFPTDLFDIIFEYLTIEEITKLRMMGRFFRDVVNSYKVPITKIPRIKYKQINAFNLNPFPFPPFQSRFNSIDLLNPVNFSLLQLPSDAKVAYSDMIEKVRETVLSLCQQKRMSSKKDAAELYRRNGEPRETCIMYTSIYALGFLLALFRELVLNPSRNTVCTILVFFLISSYIAMAPKIKKAIQRIPKVNVGQKRYLNAIRNELDRIEVRFTLYARSDSRGIPRSSQASHPNSNAYQVEISCKQFSKP